MLPDGPYIFTDPRNHLMQRRLTIEKQPPRRQPARFQLLGSGCCRTLTTATMAGWQMNSKEPVLLDWQEQPTVSALPHRLYVENLTRSECKRRCSHSRRCDTFQLDAYCKRPDSPTCRGKCWHYHTGEGLLGLACDRTTGSMQCYTQSRSAEHWRSAVSFSPAPRFGGLPVGFPSVADGHGWYSWPCPTFLGAIVCGIEWPTWMQIDAFVRPWHTVIEFGARYGTSACRLALATNNSGHVISVEPDPSVHGFLLHNRDANQCNFHAVLGTVGDRQVAMRVPPTMINAHGETSCSYACQFAPLPGGAENGARGVENGPRVAVPNFAIDEIERRIGRRINAALIDCEGCIEYSMSDALLRRLELILLEEDGGIDYRRWHAKFRAEGFARVWNARDEMRIAYSVWQRAGSAPNAGALPEEAGEKNLCADVLARGGWAELAASRSRDNGPRANHARLKCL